jgi:hypothetical protein
VAWLRAQGPLAGVAVFDAPPVRAALPYLVVEEPVCADWSTKSWAGVEARVAVTLFDAGERPARLRGLLAAVEAAVAVMPPALDGGWRVARVALARSRIAQVRGTGAGGDRWLGQAEFVARVWREV